MRQKIVVGDHIADREMASKGVLGAGTVHSRANDGWWVTCLSHASVVVRDENIISIEEALEILGEK